MAGINAATGQLLEDFAHVEQSLGKIMTTFQGERIMREWFGNPGNKLLGENAGERVLLMWAGVLYMLIELFEPRFKVVKFVPRDITRLGTFDFVMEGEYRPYAHLDFVQASFFISLDGKTVTVKRAA